MALRPFQGSIPCPGEDWRKFLGGAIYITEGNPLIYTIPGHGIPMVMQLFDHINPGTSDLGKGLALIVDWYRSLRAAKVPSHQDK